MAHFFTASQVSSSFVLRLGYFDGGDWRFLSFEGEGGSEDGGTRSCWQEAELRRMAATWTHRFSWPRRRNAGEEGSAERSTRNQMKMEGVKLLVSDNS